MTDKRLLRPQQLHQPQQPQQTQQPRAVTTHDDDDDEIRRRRRPQLDRLQILLQYATCDGVLPAEDCAHVANGFVERARRLELFCQFQPLTQVLQIAAGWHHTVLLATDGAVWGWGSNTLGQLGLPWSLAQAVVEKPRRLPLLEPARCVAAGQSKTAVVLSSDGKLLRVGRETLEVPVIETLLADLVVDLPTEEEREEEQPPPSEWPSWREFEEEQIAGEDLDDLPDDLPDDLADHLDELPAPDFVRCVFTRIYEPEFNVISLAVADDFTLFSREKNSRAFWDVIAVRKDGKQFRYCNRQASEAVTVRGAPRVCCWEASSSPQGEAAALRRRRDVRNCPTVFFSEAFCFHFVEREVAKKEG